ncbi:hypothetical protein PVAG01_04795 [Phlyctema vagabunda]|uniref:Uncharacterized protein n=1 Tax=Phlyctema vagabunda TaxID=108571 RepID=A0ABR4PI93_9HELO
MAPSEDRDKAQRDSQQPPDNPFIRFRQFADAQVGSILQSVIGLPSAFSKSTGNQRWADFDEDLKRRDELQKRRKALHDSEAEPLSGTTQQNEAAIPVKKSTDWTQSSRSDRNRPSSANDMDDEGEREWIEETGTHPTNDISLYAPVTKSLFAHLQQTAEHNVNWSVWNAQLLAGLNPTSLRGSFDWGKETLDCELHYVDRNLWQSWTPVKAHLYFLRPDQRSSNFLECQQYMALNNLNSTGDIPEQMWGKYSLHSNSSLLPYLLFSAYSPLKLSQDPIANRGPDYAAAFEDLILAYNGLPMSTTQVRGLSRSGTPRAGMEWIYSLSRAGILNEPEHLTRLENVVANTDGNGIIKELLKSMLKLDSETERPDKAPMTEQDMYDLFLQSTSLSSSSSTSTPIGLFDLIYADTERLMLRNREKIEADQRRAYAEEMGKKVVEKHTSSEASQKQPIDPERVVSTFKSSEHITHDDGTVESILSIRKRFADGRETVTETTHTRLPRNGEETTDAEQDQRPQPKNEGEKKGWFWN